MQLNLASFFLVLFFAILNEAIIEYLFGSIKNIRPYLPVIGLAFAILLTFFYALNLISLVLGVETTSPFLDHLFSAFVIARLSNFINDASQRFLKSK